MNRVTQLWQFWCTQRGDINWRQRTHTWFFPLSTRTLVTRPNGIPRWIISASVTSLGMLRMCITLDGFPFWFLSSFTCNQQHKSLKQSWGCLCELFALITVTTTLQFQAPSFIPWTSDQAKVTTGYEITHKTQNMKRQNIVFQTHSYDVTQNSLCDW